MSELYICIDCELANAQAEPTSLNEHGYCSRCGSSSVVPVDTLLELGARNKSAKHAPPSLDATHIERVKAMREQRKRDSRPLVEYLKSLIHPPKVTPGAVIGHYDGASFKNVEIITRALEEWDGWAWHVYYPWALRVDEEDNPCPGHFTIELVQGVKNGERWLITLDATLVGVSLFQDGMN